MPDRILLVEDNDENRGIFATMLRYRGFAVTEAASGARALELAREGHPHMVLLDLGLPDMNGFEVLRRMRADPDLADVPVMVVTAHVAREMEKQAEALGARRFLTKPIPPRELSDAVAEELAILRGYEAAS